MAKDDTDEPLDLQNFLAAAEAASDDENGFDLDDVLAVEEAWELDDGEVVMHGFIVALRNGDRVYLEYKTEDEEEEFSIVPLEDGVDRPDLEAMDQAVRWYKPDHITTHLYTLRPEAGTEDADE
jgi:hypothetical protein